MSSVRPMSDLSRVSFVSLSSFMEDEARKEGLGPGAMQEDSIEARCFGET
jgi:hypothetical protein